MKMCRVCARYILYWSAGEVEHTRKMRNGMVGCLRGGMGFWMSQTSRYRVRRKRHGVCCGVQMDDVLLILEVEKNRELPALERHLSRIACRQSQSCSASGLNQRAVTCAQIP